MPLARILLLVLLVLFPCVAARAAEAPTPAAPPAAPARESGHDLRLRPFPPGAYDYALLEALIIQHDGRRKPFKTFARETMLELAGRTSLPMRELTGNPGAAEDDAGISAECMAASLWLQQPGWEKLRLLRVEQSDLKTSLGLDLKRRRFSNEELVAVRPAMSALVARFRAEAMRDGTGREVSLLERHLDELLGRLALYDELSTGRAFRVVPCDNAVGGDAPGAGAWATVPFADDIWGARRPVARDRFIGAVSRLAAAFHDMRPGDAGAAAFAEAARDLVAAQSELAPEAMPAPLKVSTELRYDDMKPFRKAWIAYLLSALAFALTAFAARREGNVVGWALLACGLGFQVFGFVSRLIISGRAPVTNMYESVVWVVLVLMALAVGFSIRYRRRIFVASAVPVAGLLLLMADSLPAVFKPGITPLMPVLRDNFWLTTHVLTTVGGYAAFVLAAAVAHVALFQQVRRAGPAAVADNLFLFVYRAVQVGVVLLAAGIILGGVWANYSWGRFWGWDPKETWSLIALLAYLFVLHGRLVGWWGGFGLAAGSVLALQTVAFAWYGVNYILAAGMHSYGFGSGSHAGYWTFVAVEIAFVVAAVWRRSAARGGR